MSYGEASTVLGGLPVTKGEEMGGFGMGSTIVLVFEAPSGLNFQVSPGEKVRYGQPLARIAEDASPAATPPPSRKKANAA